MTRLPRSFAAAFALAAILAASAATAGIPAIPIPSMPGQTAPAFQGSAAVAQPVSSFAVPQHPFMAPNGKSNIHNDAYMTDAYSWKGPLGRRTGVRSTWLGLEECASLTFDSRGRIVTLCGTLDGARLRMLDPVTLATLAILPLPPRSVRPGTTPFTDFCAAGYFFLDHRDRGVLSTNTNQIWVLSILQPTFVLERIYNLVPHVPLTDCLASVLPDWSGRYWFVSKGGIVGTVDRASGHVQTLQLHEAVTNSFAVDDTGGVFIVSDHALYRFDAGPDGAPRKTWRVVYDRGTRHKPGQLGPGSGTTPTLIGTDYVAITDNADPRMHVEVYRRAASVLGSRFVCREPVFAAGKGATDNSLIAVGNSLIVENNYGYTGVTATAGGKSTEPGVARVDFDPGSGTCSTVWTSNERAPTTVPKASLAAGLIYTYAKPPRADGTDAWYFTAIDFRTGQTVFRRLTGTGYLYNNHYAPVSLSPSGAAYVGALGGLIRIADR